MDLFTVGPSTVSKMIAAENDPCVIRILVKLERAADNGDEIQRFEAIGELSDLLVLERGAE